MEPFILFSLLGLAGLAFFDFGGKDGADENDEAEGDTFLVEPGSILEGTDAADTFSLNDEHIVDAPVTIAAGAGDDILTLWREDESARGSVLERGSTVSAENGNDTIFVSGDVIKVSGGSGDDNINAFVGASSIYGDTGNDMITIVTGGDGSSAFGGQGDDFIDGREIQNGGLFGGSGDDVIVIKGGSQGGAGYIIAVEGGDGDDTIRLDGHKLDSADEPIVALGGTGADTYDLDLYRSAPAGQLFEPESKTLITLGDFAPGEDQVVINLDDELTGSAPDAPSYTLSSGEIIEDTTAGVTELVFCYKAAGAENLKYTVRLNAIDITWDDISFDEGTSPPELFPST